jgi:hypothetical protein
MTGYQHCHDVNPPGVVGSVWGGLLCMSLDGTSAGHVDYYNSSEGYKCGPTGPKHVLGYYLNCFPPIGHSITDFWLATLNEYNLTWTETQAGAQIPTNAYRIGNLFVARSNLNAGRNVIPGFSKPAGNTLGPIDYEDYGSHTEQTFQIATCHPPTHSPFRCDNATGKCVNVTAGTPGVHFPTQQACAATCVPPAPPPLSQNPCIRFGHAIPLANRVDVEIMQNNDAVRKYTWTNYAFAQFSDWVNIFTPGSGTITVPSPSSNSLIIIQVSDY